MSRSFHCSVDSSLTVQQIHGAFAERDFWLLRLAETGGAAVLQSFAVRQDGAVVFEAAQEIGSSVLPGPIKRIFPGGLEAVQGQTWTLEGGEKLCGEVRTRALGARGSGLGRLVLTANRDAECVECTGKFDFKVPFVGGTLETLFGRQMVDQTPDLLRFTARWVDEHA